jgi:hypothetical protein
MFKLLIRLATHIYMLLWFWKSANAYLAMSEKISRMHNLEYKEILVEYLDTYPYTKRNFLLYLICILWTGLKSYNRPTLVLKPNWLVTKYLMMFM